MQAIFAIRRSKCLKIGDWGKKPTFLAPKLPKTSCTYWQPRLTLLPGPFPALLGPDQVGFGSASIIGCRRWFSCEKVSVRRLWTATLSGSRFRMQYSDSGLRISIIGTSEMWQQHRSHVADVAPVRLQHCRSDQLRSSRFAHFVLESLKLQPITFIACIQSSNININSSSSNINIPTAIGQLCRFLIRSIWNCLMPVWYGGHVRRCLVTFESTSIIFSNCSNCCALTMSVQESIAGPLWVRLEVPLMGFGSPRSRWAKGVGPELWYLWKQRCNFLQTKLGIIFLNSCRIFQVNT